MEELKVKEFTNSKEVCEFVNSLGIPDIETIVVFNGLLQVFYWEH